jgi:hypothetical protein
VPLIETLEFDAPTHTYKLKGRQVPGVSTVLQPLLKLDDIPEHVLEHAKLRGQAVHEACHAHNLGGLYMDDLEEEVASRVRGYLMFHAEAGFISLASEIRVASPKYGYAGTLDLYGILKRGEAMVDLKSTAAIPRTAGPQTAAYKQALEETTGQKSKRRYVLHLKPDAYKLVEISDGAGVQDFTVFLSALNIHKWRLVK